MNRERSLDLFRAVAIVRVVCYHMFTVAWFSYAFPAMGVMFALGGSLMVRSIDRGASRAVRGRVRRLLPALWVLGAVAVPAMLAQGWTPSWPRLALWVLPVADPPGSDWGTPATEVLWYLVTYLWLVLLSPLAVRAYRRRPVLTALTPPALLAVLTFAPSPLPDPVREVAVNVATFGACWIVGFAHREGTLARIPLVRLLILAGALAAAGVGWAVTHAAGAGTYDLNGIPVAQAAYSLGFVLVLMRLRVPTGWLARFRPADRLVTVLNARAVTVYLWHNPAIALSFVVGDAVHAYRFGNAGYLLVAVGLLLVPLLLFGWVEDVAAKRRPTLVPGARPRPAATQTPPAPGSPTVAVSGPRHGAAPAVPRPRAPWINRT